MTRTGAWLFVPGDRPERFAKAAASGADEVIVDLEDAVAADDKSVARDAVASWLRGGGAAWVRANATETAWHTADIEALRGIAGLRGVVLPKSETPDEVAAVHERLGVPVVALVESALGVGNATAICGAPGLTRLAFGSVDFALDIDAVETRESLAVARSLLVLASRVAGLGAPIDGVTQSIDDVDRILSDARHARGLGFGAKLAIHPRQVGAIAEAFAPGEAEIAWAREVLTAAGATGAGGAVRVDGRMVDAPVVERARRLLARVEPSADGQSVTDA